MEAVRAAIDDAGLVAADIDGIATLCDTPADEVNAALWIHPADCGTGFGTGGLLNPVMSACHAVPQRQARHEVVYRTMQMLGDTAAAEESRFHIGLAQLAGNALLDLFLRIIAELFHQRIVEEITDGDDSLARYRIRRHLDAATACWL